MEYRAYRKDENTGEFDYIYSDESLEELIKFLDKYADSGTLEIKMIYNK